MSHAPRPRASAPLSPRLFFHRAVYPATSASASACVRTQTCAVCVVEREAAKAVAMAEVTAVAARAVAAREVVKVGERAAEGRVVERAEAKALALAAPGQARARE